MSMQDIQHEWAEDFPPVADPEPLYDSGSENVAPTFTVSEIERALGLWREYVAERPTSKIGPREVRHWELELALARLERKP